MRKPETVSYYKHSAKIYKANDGFHATWYLNGKRVKKQFSTLKSAKESALEALRLIHKGEGDRPSQNGRYLVQSASQIA